MQIGRLAMVFRQSLLIVLRCPPYQRRDLPDYVFLADLRYPSDAVGRRGLHGDRVDEVLAPGDDS